jgi:AraC-like DNA-binding protein
LAAVARLSVSHFSRAFRVSFGQPPHGYVMSRRIEKAKRLILSNEPMSLAQVALSCGLSDQAHLSRMFRNLVGESPTAWRRRYWSPIKIYRPSNAASATVSSHQSVNRLRSVRGVNLPRNRRSSFLAGFGGSVELSMPLDLIVVRPFRPFIHRVVKAMQMAKHPDAILLSAHAPEDVSALRDTIMGFFEAAMVEDVLVLPYAKLGLIGEVYESARVLSEEHDETGRVLKVRGLPAAITRLRRSLAAR